MFNWWGQRYSTVGNIFFFIFKAEHMVRPGIQIKVQISSNKTGHSQGSLEQCDLKTKRKDNLKTHLDSVHAV